MTTALPLRLVNLARSLPIHFHDLWRGETGNTYFDLGNCCEVNRELANHGAEPLSIDPGDASEGVSGAARYILANLVCNRAVRRQYPQALHEDSSGSFARFLCDGLGPAAAASVRACLDQPPGEPVKRVLEVREDLRGLYPFALTPRQRHQFLAWLLAHGRRELGLSAEGALWCLIELDETSDRGLIPSYLTNPLWQEQQPLALTAFGWNDFKSYLRSKYDIHSRWLERATWRPTMRPWDELLLLKAPDLPATANEVPSWLKSRYGYRDLPRRWLRELHRDYANGLPKQASVNVIGHYRYASGLQEACAGVINALESQNVRTVKRDLPVHHPADWRDRERYQGLEVHGTTIYVAAANTFPKEYFRRSGLYLRPGVRRIAVWYWEVDRLPAEWTNELKWPSEVWAPTRFLADAYRKSVSVPVVPMLPGVSLPAFAKKPRGYFDLPSDRFLMLFSFDMGSVMERKNPLGLIEAWRQAFRPDDGAHLCIKVSRGEFHPQNLAKLRDACRSIGATLLDTVLPREDVLALFDCADCYASLHRAEGFGLGMAESMLLGKPVIATAYSGNLDFMTDDNSLLVPASLIEIENTPPYPDGSVWAEPDLDHAASRLRFVFDHRDDALQIAARGQRETLEKLSIAAAGRRMTARLAELR